MAGKPKSLKDQFTVAKDRVEKRGPRDEAREGPGMRTSASPRPLLLVFLLLAAPPASAQEPYKLPPKEVVELVDAPPPPQAVVSPTGDAVLLAEPEAYPPIALLAEPVLRLGGVRISPATGCRQRTFRFTGLRVQPVSGGPAVRLALPAGARVGLPVFSHDGRRFAFARDLADGVELWAGETTTGAARPVPGVRLNDVLGPAIAWRGDGRLLVRAVPPGRGKAPAAPTVPVGPLVEETAGKASQMATFQDLLRTPHDETVFEHFARAQLAVVDAVSGTAMPLGEPGLYTDAEPSPDGRYLLVQRVKPPYSTRVPFYFFAARDRGVGRLGPDGGDDRRPAGVRRGPPPGRPDRSARGGLAAARAGDGGLGRGARRRRPREEGAAPRAPDDARRPVHGGAYGNRRGSSSASTFSTGRAARAWPW